MKRINREEIFENPKMEYRTAPLWVWNSYMNDEEIRKMLVELKLHGFGGAFVHPRPGMRVSYMDKKWFQAWNAALEAAKELGMKLNIYDENSYPSGFGGGHVSAKLPDCLAESISYEVFSEEKMDFTEKKDNWIGNKKTIAVYACSRENGKNKIICELTDLPKKEWKGRGSHYIILEQMPSEVQGWMAGFANVDLLRPEVTETFLSCIYDAYAEHFQEDFGNTIQAIFTDEPSLPGSSVYGMDQKKSLPVSQWFAYEFQKRKGYDFISSMPALFEDWEGMDNKKIRHDYYEVTQELWVQNFVKPIYQWCQKHKIAFTGHFMEDGWPKPFYEVVEPSIMASYEYQDWPGIDLLLSKRLKAEANEPQQITLLEVMSAAHQFGKERVLCEAYGAGGYDSTLEDYKRMGDYLLVNGITYINEHLSYTSYIGARKRDHPQSFDWRQPWWNDYTELNDYFARLSSVLSQGRPRERILVINPTITGYLYPRTDDYSQLVHNQLAKDMDVSSYLKLLQELRRRQWDFNLGDEIIIKRHGKVQGNKLQIQKQEYSVVILHECMKNMLPTTLTLLQEFLEQGGIVISIGHPGPYLGGEKKAYLYEQLERNRGYQIVADKKFAVDRIENILTPYFEVEKEFPMGVESIRRELDDNTVIFFFTNHSKKQAETRILFHGKKVEEWNPWNGKINKEWTVGQGQKDIQICFDLKDGESVCYCVYQKAEEMQEEKVKAETQEELQKLVFTEIYPESENVWPLEYCNLKLDGKEYKDISTLAACNKIYKHRGFLGNPWDNEVQFGNRTYERNRFYSNGSGFEAEYFFEIEQGYHPASLFLSVEYGTRYHIWVNDKLVEQKIDSYFMDDYVDSYEIASYVQEGLNKIKIEAEKFDVELELDFVTLRGNFGIFQKENKWIMAEKQKMHLGNWNLQGYPFYGGAVCYEANYLYDGDGSAALRFPRIEATAVSVWVNGKRQGLINSNGEKEFFITDGLVKGKNKIMLRVCGSLKNMIGPHFDPEKPRNTAWPDMWRKARKKGQPAAKEYDLILYGIEKEQLICIKRK